MSDEIPFVAIDDEDGSPGAAPWVDLPLTCPECGAGPLALKDSDPPGFTFISHCGGVWLRGQPDLGKAFGS